ncbi:MAG: hypothetical protein LC775_02670 [Acidobacteria bacterium]|nr:hypothetical protein [Acidobacteriota bacterium]
MGSIDARRRTAASVERAGAGRRTSSGGPSEERWPVGSRESGHRPALAAGIAGAGAELIAAPGLGPEGWLAWPKIKSVAWSTAPKLLADRPSAGRRAPGPGRCPPDARPLIGQEVPVKPRQLAGVVVAHLVGHGDHVRHPRFEEGQCGAGVA